MGRRRRAPGRTGACCSTPSTPTEAGHELHRHIEATTDDLALRGLVGGMGSADAVLDLADELTPLAQAISASGVLPFPNPIGLPDV